MEWHMGRHEAVKALLPQWPRSPKYASNYCFGSAYVPGARSLAIPAESTDVQYVRQLRGFVVTRALGAMLSM